MARRKHHTHRRRNKHKKAIHGFRFRKPKASKEGIMDYVAAGGGAIAADLVIDKSDKIPVVGAHIASLDPKYKPLIGVAAALLIKEGLPMLGVKSSHEINVATTVMIGVSIGRFVNGMGWISSITGVESNAIQNTRPDEDILEKLAGVETNAIQEAGTDSVNGQYSGGGEY